MVDSPVLLDDAAMRRFIIEGYLVLKPEFPDEFHRGVYEHLQALISARGNPANNLLPWVPELRQVWEHPVVNGALASILGSDYYLHLHRHVHDNPPGSAGQQLHKDSLFNSRFAVDDHRRHHRTRWVMAFYYPQDTPIELGPTGIMPRSQYLNVERPEGVDEVALTGDAGTVTLVHYDLLHKGMPNRSDRVRYMAKFLFTRMSEPSAPSWNHVDSAWQPTGDAQDPIWRHLWDWHRGAIESLDSSSRESIKTLVNRLSHESERIGLPAAYELGARGTEALPYLIDALKAESDAVPRNAAYGFDRMGSAAVPALLDATRDPNERIRARALDVLGDMGRSAASAVPGLIDSLADEAPDPRRRAAEALGTAGRDVDGLDGPLAERLTRDEDGEVRRNAALSLARLGARAAGAVPALERGTIDANHFVRGYSEHALSRIPTPAAQQALIRYLQTTRLDWEQH